MMKDIEQQRLKVEEKSLHLKYNLPVYFLS